MRLSLYSVLVNFFTAFTSAAVKVESNSVGESQHSLDGHVSNQHLLFQADVSTKLACATACTKYDSCVAFSTTPKGPSSKKMTCRAHRSVSISYTSTTDAAGSRTYFIKNRRPHTAWLNHSCDSNSDCPSTVDNVECFAGKCLCTPGYYYSNCSNSCVPDCAPENLQSTFLYYPNHYIPHNNNIVINNCATFEEGLPHCLSTTQCRTLELYTSMKDCHLQIVTALTPGVQWKNSSSGTGQIYQRTCQ